MATEKNWTVMVYMAGDNNLDSAGVVDLTEMKKVGSTKEINILVQFDREGRNMATNRYYVQKGGHKRKLSPLYKTFDFTKKSAWDEFLRAYKGWGG